MQLAEENKNSGLNKTLQSRWVFTAGFNPEPDHSNRENRQDKNFDYQLLTAF